MGVTTLRVRVASRKVEVAGIDSFELVPLSGGTLPPFTAGSHIDVVVSEGLVRQYSLLNDPSENHRYLIGVLKDEQGRGGSKALHERLVVDCVVEISPPRNHFSLAPDASTSLLLAGGIGVTPMLCMAERLATEGSKFEMHYCTRSLDRTAFRDWIGGGRFADHVHFHFDDGNEAQKLDIGKLLEAQPADVHLYVCGPMGFMNAMLGAARAHGLPEKQLHFEYFNAVPNSDVDNSSFEVQLAKSGKVIVVPADKSVAQALAESGVNIKTSCEQGVCGSCLTRVLSGVVDHRDMFLSDAERLANDQFLPCCSRSKTQRLVLDLME